MGDSAARGGGCDFDGDGFDDLAIGARRPSALQYVHGEFMATRIQVLYGTSSGLSADRNQLVDRQNTALSASAGWTLGCGDFDGDGFDDLATGAPFHNVHGTFETSGAGAVQILPGSESGLSASRLRTLHRDQDGVEHAARRRDHFGLELGTGDFDGDGYADLAVGVEYDNVHGSRDAGSVHVFYGTAAGLTAERDEVWHRGRNDIDGEARAFDRFGDLLAVGDFDGDGFDDLTIGVSTDDVDGIPNAGSLQVLYGTGEGLSAARNQVWHRDKHQVKRKAKEGDYFGGAVTAGDFDGDGFDDLAIGVSKKDRNGRSWQRAVHVLYGTGEGLSSVGDQIWHRDRPLINGKRWKLDQFGASVMAADFDGDGIDDLAVGAPGDTVAKRAGVGSVQVIYGTGDGLAAKGDQLFHRAKLGIPRNVFPEGEGVGSRFTWGDFDMDGTADLAFGVPKGMPNRDGEPALRLTEITCDPYRRGPIRFCGYPSPGFVGVLYGDRTGLDRDRYEEWSRISPGIPGGVERDDYFASVGP